MAKSIFDPTNQDDTVGEGLGGFLSPPGKSHSKMPDDLTDGKVEEDKEEAELEKKAETDPTQAVEQIKEALDERLHGKEIKTEERTDGPR